MTWSPFWSTSMRAFVSMSSVTIMYRYMNYCHIKMSVQMLSCVIMRRIWVYTTAFHTTFSACGGRNNPQGVSAHRLPDCGRTRLRVQISKFQNICTHSRMGGYTHRCSMGGGRKSGKYSMGVVTLILPPVQPGSCFTPSRVFHVRYAWCVLRYTVGVYAMLDSYTH